MKRRDFFKTICGGMAAILLPLFPLKNNNIVVVDHIRSTPYTRNMVTLMKEVMRRNDKNKNYWKVSKSECI